MKIKEDFMKTKKGTKIISFLILMAILFLIMPINLANAGKANTLDVNKGDVVISQSGDYTISGVTDKYTITLKKGTKANITLKDININNSSNGKYPLKIENGATGMLILTGDNNLENKNHHGVFVMDSGKLTISNASTGTLSATGGGEGAGIGGSGSILIKGGTIKAIGGLFGNGIGFGTSSKSNLDNMDDKAGNVTISGGNVTAIGGKLGSAGIGYSSTETKGKITITGGNVYATSGSSGIGSYDSSAGNEIEIIGGNVTAIGNAYSAGIGNNIKPQNTTVTIRGGMVTAISDRGTDLYDSNYFPHVGEVFDVAADKITITGGMTYFDKCSTTPQNDEGESLFHRVIQSKSGKIKKIMVNQNSYGSKDVISEGILYLWLPSAKANSYLEVEFEAGSKTEINSDDINKFTKLPVDFNFDLSISDLEVYSTYCVYNKNIYVITNKEVPLKITGNTSDHQIIVHNGSHSFELHNLNVDYTKQNKKDFFILDSDVKVFIYFKNKNKIQTGNDSIGFYVGQNAMLSFAAPSKEDTISFESSGNSSSIFTSNGNINQYGGTITYKAEQNSSGVYLGNRGTFALYGGIMNGTSDASVLSGSNYSNVSVFGGTLNVDTMGCLEEVTDMTTQNFMITNGEVNVSNRLIFTDFTIVGGSMNVHLLGSGYGTDLTMYGGDVWMDQFITDYSSYYDKVKGKYIEFQYETSNGVSKESLLNKTTLFGGNIKETHNVMVSELKKIVYGHQ